MLRLPAETYAENVPRLYHPLHPFTADTLHCLGEKLSPTVCKIIPLDDSQTNLCARTLFGEEEDEDELDEAEKAGENREMLSFLNRWLLTLVGSDGNRHFTSGSASFQAR